MLTIRTNLVFKSLFPIIPAGNSMCERIRSGYDIIAARFEPEELLHMVMSSPEILLAGAGMTQLVTNTAIVNNQYTKRNAVNNLMNRILWCQTDQFTYQDTVYIQSILQKMGIADVNEFMRQVCILQEDTRDTGQLIRFYEKSKEALRILAGTADEKKADSQEEERRAEEIPDFVYYLQESIYNRLQTRDIHEKLSKVYENNLIRQEQVTEVEFRLAEQYKITSHMLLNKLQSMITSKICPAVFRHFNKFEMERPAETESTDKNAANQLTAAVLLNLADNLYTIRNMRIYNGQTHRHFYHKGHLRNQQDIWYDISNAFYETSVNTLSRFGKTQVVNSYLKEGERFGSRQIHYAGIPEEYRGASQEHAGVLQEYADIPREDIVISKEAGNTGARSGDRFADSLAFVPPKVEEDKKEYYNRLRKQLEMIDRQNIQRYFMMMQWQSNEALPNRNRIQFRSAQKAGSVSTEHPALETSQIRQGGNRTERDRIKPSSLTGRGNREYTDQQDRMEEWYGQRDRAEGVYGQGDRTEGVYGQEDGTKGVYGQEDETADWPISKKAEEIMQLSGQRQGNRKQFRSGQKAGRVSTEHPVRETGQIQQREDRTEQDRKEQDRKEQDRKEQDRTKPSSVISWENREYTKRPAGMEEAYKTADRMGEFYVPEDETAERHMSEKAEELMRLAGQRQRERKQFQSGQKAGQVSAEHPVRGNGQVQQGESRTEQDRTKPIDLVGRENREPVKQPDGTERYMRRPDVTEEAYGPESEKEGVYEQGYGNPEGLISAETREILRLTQLQLKYPKEGYLSGKIRPVPAEQFTQELNEINREHHQALLFQTNGEMLPMEGNNGGEHLEELLTHEVMSRRKSVSEREPGYVFLVHKQMNHFLNEEVLEEIYKRNRAFLQESEKAASGTMTEVTAQTEEIHIQERAEERSSIGIEDRIIEDVQVSLNRITDQVYDRLEKRLEMERKRRGY